MTLKEISEKYGLNDKERTIFEEYTKNRFSGVEETDPPDIDYLGVWYRIKDYAGVFGVDKAINDKVSAKRPVEFHSPEKLSLEIYDSFAGKIPIITVRDPEDFEQLVTNIAYKGIRPDNISSTGASFISGKTTRFIILSAKAYSNVPASELGISDASLWQEKSIRLRRGHECTHFYTKQIYGITNNILHDEIMADFIGMVEAFGFYKAEWFLRFMGIIEGGGSRLIFYTKELPEKVRSAVSGLAKIIAGRLEIWSNTDNFKRLGVHERIKIMCRSGLEGMLTDIS